MLAAYIDGGLEPRERAEVEEHLAECSECYENFAETVKTSAEIGSAQSAGASIRKTAPAWSGARMAGLGLAATVLMSIGVYQQWFSNRARVAAATRQVVEGVGGRRFTLGRVDLGVSWSEPPAATRGKESEAPLAIRDALVTLERLANSGDARALNAFGLAQLAAGHFDASVTALESAVAAAPAAPDYASNLSAAFLERWRVGAVAEDLVSALSNAETALRISPNHQTALYNKAQALESMGLREQAVAAWEGYLSSDGASEWAGEARAHVARLKGAGQERQGLRERLEHGDLSSAADLATRDPEILYRFQEQLLDSWLANPDVSVANGVAVGQFLSRAGRDRELTETLQMAVDSARFPAARRDTIRAALLQFHAALAIYAQANANAAEPLARRAFESLREAGVDTLAAETTLQQITFSVKRDPASASAAATLGQRAAERNYLRLAARTQQTAGTQAARGSNFDLARAEYDRGLALAERAGDLELVSAFNALSAELLLEQGDPQSAWERNCAALAVLERVKTYRLAHIVLTVAGSAAEQTNQAGAGVVFSAELLSLAERANNPIGIAAGHIRRARALAVAIGPEAAIPDIDAAKAAQLAIADGTIRAGYAGDIGWSEGFILKRADPARAVRALDGALTIYQKNGNRARLAEVFLARGEAHLAAGDRAAATADWTAGAAIFEDQRASTRDDQLRISRFSRLWNLFGLLIEQRRDNPLAALEIVEESKARALLDAIGRGASSAPLKSTALYDWLPDGVSALVYSVHNERLLLFVVNRTGVTLTEADTGAAELSTLVARYQDEVSRNQPGPAGERLAALLLPPQLPLSADIPLVIVPDGPLHRVPFAALPFKNRRLIDAAVVVNAPSLSAIRAMSGPGWTPPASAAVLAPSGNGGLGLGVLRGAVEEAHNIAGLYPEADLVIGSDATADRSLAAFAGRPVVHFAGHAVTDDRYPWKSHLVSAGENGALTPARISASRLQHGSLVVLGACDTAGGAFMRGEGALTLARSFLMAGASGVVASLWPVSDSQTPALLMDFHRRVIRGETPALALAHAQRAQIAAGPNMTWSAFEFIGRLF